MVRTQKWPTSRHRTTDDFSLWGGGLVRNVRPVNNAVGADIRNGTWTQSGELEVRVFPTNLDFTMTGTRDCQRTKERYM